MQRRAYLIHPPGWLWLYCGAGYPICGHSGPVALVPYAIKWNLYDSISIAERLRRTAKCSVCGHVGATTIVPSWGGGEVGVRPFPVRR